MDDRRFDSLTKAVASGASRRSVLKGILGLGSAAIAGGVALESEADAARRPTPTPKPPRCPGSQTWDSTLGTCVCPANLSQCVPGTGPACCNDVTVDPGEPGYSECCDNACCTGTCYGEELCCPTNSGPGEQPPTHAVCDGACIDLTQNGCCSASDCGVGSYECIGHECVGSRCPEGQILCGEECCAEDQCVAGQGCCPAYFVACGGSCCNTEVYFCNESDQCECLTGTEACGLLPGGCCPTGQCNTNFGVCCEAGTEPCGESCCATGQCNTAGGCCAAGATACGSACCDDASETCGEGTTCICAEGFIECDGSCAQGQCCGANNATCADLGYDLECVTCTDGACATQGRDLQPCQTNNSWCSSGQCLACIPYLKYGCSIDSQCCNATCLGGRCDTQ